MCALKVLRVRLEREQIMCEINRTTGFGLLINTVLAQRRERLSSISMGPFYSPEASHRTSVPKCQCTRSSAAGSPRGGSHRPGSLLSPLQPFSVTFTAFIPVITI